MWNLFLNLQPWKPAILALIWQTFPSYLHLRKGADTGMAKFSSVDLEFAAVQSVLSCLLSTTPHVAHYALLLILNGSQEISIWNSGFVLIRGTLEMHLTEHNLKPQTSVSHGLHWRQNTTPPYLNLMLVSIRPCSLRLLDHDWRSLKFCIFPNSGK